ncbi:lysophospholipid acyltransferase family protein [Microterricola viridarii]|uniref:1-acyl-sn-glycerol-3-phosphate acyltransferases n=1 Tax=Microterricola viridarii TaxID=412690 RepID=A0A1H1W0W3_9MICO|nr:lysophospholipid acyltransferase family protein [Microterricola viridarii]SDS90734.1 1-acyl-sn-glycerol-3-phosphate acyltransferases [Microterricola viridarii]
MATHGSEPIYSSAVAVGRSVFGLLRLQRKVTGIEHVPNEGGAILAITHFGYLDFALTEWVIWCHNRRKVRFMAKESVFAKPVLGFLLRGMRHIPVNMKAGAAAFDSAVTALKAGELLGVFPEAGVNASFTVRDLKTGAVRLAAQAGVPIIPVAVWGGHRVLTKNHKPTLRDAYKTLVSVTFGPPITIGPTADPVELTHALHAELQTMVDTLQSEYPVDGTGQWWQPRHLSGTAPTPEEAAAADAERKLRREAEAAERARKTP